MTTTTPGNRLLLDMPPQDRHAILLNSTLMEFPQGHVFWEPGDAIEHALFVERGVVSAVAVLEDGRTVETLMTGREGLCGATAAMAPHAAHTRSVAQIAVTGRRIDTARLRALSAERPAIRDAVAAFVARLQGDLEQSAACNALHRADQRFAKWLLRCHDRVDGSMLHLTQEYLAAMLGSQRTTVNEAAQALQRVGAIGYSRGRIAVLDRDALQRTACECYRSGNSADTSVASAPPDLHARLTTIPHP